MTGEPVMVTPAEADLQVNQLTTGKGRGKSLPKAKALMARPKSQPKTEHAAEFEDLMANNVEFEEDVESYEVIDPANPATTDVSHLEQRMLHLESALTRVIQHLETQSAQTSEPHGV